MRNRSGDKLDWLSEYRKGFLKVGLALEMDRDAWKELWTHNEIRSIAYVDVPAQFNPHPFTASKLDTEDHPYVLRLAIMERLARYDASALLALPSPSLCAGLVSQLCSDDQQRLFFERFCYSPTWAFFAATEPHVGSDLSNVATSLVRCGGQWRLDGSKTMVGNADRADIGIVLARGSRQPVFVIVEPKVNPLTVHIRPLPTIGLVGLELCSVTITQHVVLQDRIIGTEIGPLRYGVAAIGSLLMKHRPLVAAMALGTARGLVDLLADIGIRRSILAPFELEHRTLLHRQERIGYLQEHSRLCMHDVSLFKLQATDFVRRVASFVPQVLSPGDMVAMRVINKKYRDALAFEYMEGTQNIHRLHSYNSYLAGERNDSATHSVE